MIDHPLAAVLIVNYHCSEATLGLLDSLPSVSSQPLCVSVVDNSLDSREADALRAGLNELEERGFCCHLEIADANLGYAAGNNHAYAAIPHGRPRYVLVANPDTSVSRGSLDDLWRTLDQAPGAVAVPTTVSVGQSSAVASELFLPTGKSTHLASFPRDVPHPDVRRVHYPGGHFWAMSTEAWESIGGLSSAYFLYGEEADFMLRSALAGRPLRLALCDALEVTHDQGLTTRAASRQKSITTYYHATRSRVVLYRQHPPLRRWLPAFGATRVLFAAVLLARGRAPQARAVVGGLWAGLRASRARAQQRSTK